MGNCGLVVSLGFTYVRVIVPFLPRLQAVYNKTTATHGIKHCAEDLKTKKVLFG